ncbi:MAG: RNA methyltransferase, partial [Gemmatimonadota bacterium]
MPSAIRHCYAATHPGIEQITARELDALGIAAGRAEPGGVEFTADLEALIAANLQLRTASRVL